MRFVAFLRAINVGGHNVKMDALKTVFESAGLANVATFIASGNVIFDSAKGASTLEKLLEQTLESALGYRVATFVRSLAELQEIAQRRPFAARDGKTYIGFLKKPPDAATATALLSLRTEIDDLTVVDREIYWLNRGAFAESKLSGGLLEKTLKGQTTLRNTNTVEKIAAKY